MGVELRSIQRKFHSLMGEVKPSVRPRFVVWLDERLAEFKIKGEMDLSETLDDPRWLKSYYSSKREAKAAAILKRESRTGGSSGGSLIHPKLEAQSESSNGVAHPTELERLENKPDVQIPAEPNSGEIGTEEEPKHSEGSDFHLVEVKQEQLEEDDDMIIVGESVESPVPQTFTSQYNQSRQMPSMYTRNQSIFPKKRQRFSAFPSRPNLISGNRFKSRMKHTMRTGGIYHPNRPYPSHTVTSQSAFPAISLSQSYPPEPVVFPGDTVQVYESSGQEPSFDESLTLGANESLRIPPHLQSQAGELNISGGGYGGDEGEMYTDYGDESYDSSYITDPTETSLRFDEEGNAVIQGEQQGDDLTGHPFPGTSDASISQDMTAYCASTLTWSTQQNIKAKHPSSGPYPHSWPNPHTAEQQLYLQPKRTRHVCEICDRSFAGSMHLQGHMNTVHFYHRPFACDCGISFCYKSSLNRHLRVCSKRSDL